MRGRRDRRPRWRPSVYTMSSVGPRPAAISALPLNVAPTTIVIARRRMSVMPLTVADIVRRLGARGSAFSPEVPELVQRTIRAFVPRTALDVLAAWFPWTRDEALAMDPEVPEQERMAAI